MSLLLGGLFLLAAWGIVPLGLRHAPSSRPLKMARLLQPVAALLTTASFFVPTGSVAGLLAGPWLLLDGLLALAALLELRRSLLLAAALGLPLVGGIHLVASRLGIALGGFPEPIVLLTAIHFHYIGFAAPLLARATQNRSGTLAGLGVVGGTLLLAAGFVVSPALKAFAVALLCASLLLLAAAQLQSLRGLGGRERLLLGVSSLSLVAGMILAAVYEHGFYTGRSWLSIPQMAWSHGILNGVGFALCGLLARRSGMERPGRRDS